MISKCPKGGQYISPGQRPGYWEDVKQALKGRDNEDVDIDKSTDVDSKKKDNNKKKRWFIKKKKKQFKHYWDIQVGIVGGAQSGY